MHHPTDRITHTTAFVTPVVEHWLEREIAWSSVATVCCEYTHSVRGAELFMCPCPLKVQARPPQDQRLARPVVLNLGFIESVSGVRQRSRILRLFSTLIFMRNSCFVGFVL